MVAWEKEIGAINLFVDDLDRSRTFYQDVFGLPVVIDEDDVVMFRFKSVPVFINKASAAHKLIGPAEVGSPDAGSRVQLVIIVDDVDAVCAELTEKGVMLINGPADRPWGMRTAAFADPAGYFWEIAQELPEEA